MENQKSKITEEYKAEITSILSRISQDLGQSVKESIEPKINDFTEGLKNNLKSIGEINIEQKKMINEVSNHFKANNVKIDSFSKKLDSVIISNDKLIIKTNVEIKKVIISEFFNFTTKIDALYKSQFEIQINDFRSSQKKTNRLLLILIFIFILVMVFSIFNFLKLNQ